MQASPAVSVLMPSYNHGRFVEEAIESVLASREIDLEIVVVDDGSTDDTLERLARWSRESRLRLYRQENCGAHAALNRCLEQARGELIFILNSDDAFEPGRIPRLTRVLTEQSDVAMAASWIRVVDEAGIEIGVKEGWHNMPPWPRTGSGPTIAGLDDERLALLETNYISTTSNLAFRRELVDQHGLRFRSLRYAHDWEFILSACQLGRIFLVDEPLVRYRVHGANTIREGAESSQGQMRLEIQWAVARHAVQMLERAAETSDLDFTALKALAWNSMPSFGRQTILNALLLLRGSSDEPPAAYDALIEPSHPFYQESVAVLAEDLPNPERFEKRAQDI